MTNEQIMQYNESPTGKVGFPLKFEFGKVSDLGRFKTVHRETTTVFDELETR